MWLNALVIVATPDADAFRRASLDAAMTRRGWEQQGSEGYLTSFANVESDEAVVKLIERDVQQSAYVAGVDGYESVCMLSENPVMAELRREFGDGAAEAE